MRVTTPTMHDRNQVDARTVRARAIAKIIRDLIEDREVGDVELIEASGVPTTLEVLWDGTKRGTLYLRVPRFNEEPPKFTLKVSDRSGTYKKVSTLVERIIELCKPPTAFDMQLAERHANAQQLNRAIERIEGPLGNIGRYLHARRLTVASWLARQGNEKALPTEMRSLVETLRREVTQAAELRERLAEMEGEPNDL